MINVNLLRTAVFIYAQEHISCLISVDFLITVEWFELNGIVSVIPGYLRCFSRYRGTATVTSVTAI